MKTKHLHDKSLHINLLFVNNRNPGFNMHAKPGKKRAEEWERAEPEERCGCTAEGPVAGVIYLWSKPSWASHWGLTNQGSPVQLTRTSGRGDTLQHSIVHCEDTEWSVHVLDLWAQLPSMSTKLLALKLRQAIIQSMGGAQFVCISTETFFQSSLR